MNLTRSHETDQHVLPPFSTIKVRQQCKLQHLCVHMLLFMYIEFVRMYVVLCILAMFIYHIASGYNCDPPSKNQPSLHLVVFREIPF